MDKHRIDQLMQSMTRQLRVAVIGDIMQDVYQYGSVNRISPEFPVPILHSTDGKAIPVPGGAGNVAAQFAHLNVRPWLFGLVDSEMESVLSSYNFCLDGCVRLANGHNPKKIRFYDGDFPLLRYDIEATKYGCDNLYCHQMELYDRFAKILKEVGFDVVILSNYSKGLFNEELAQRIIKVCNQVQVPTIVDPKSHLDWWKGCRIFKPNASEARAFCPTSGAWMDQAIHIRQQIGCWGVVITRAGDGVSGYYDRPFNYEPRVPSKDVSSVIGAGDCFAAVLAFGIGHELPIATACELAFEAGVEYVKVKHNRPITWYELHRRLDPVHAKYLNTSQLLRVKQHILQGQKLVFTNGCFDILHSGHMETLNFAKSLGHKLIVAINSDESVKRLKGPRRPILPLVERVDVLTNLACVDFVVSFDESDPYTTIDAIQPDIIVKGAEYYDRQVAGPAFQGEVVLAPMKDRISTTGIIERVLEKHFG